MLTHGPSPASWKDQNAGSSAVALCFSVSVFVPSLIQPTVDMLGARGHSAKFSVSRPLFVIVTELGNFHSAFLEVSGLDGQWQKYGGELWSDSFT